MHAFRYIGMLVIPLLVLLLYSGCQTTQAAWKKEISLDYVTELAAELAEEPYDDSWGKVPDFLTQLSYDDYQKIWFRPEEALWRQEALPFQIRFFHPGSVYRRAVKIHEFTESHVQQIRFLRNFFCYTDQQDLADRVPSSLGYSGFSIYYPVDEKLGMSECAVFLGSNYFRIIGAHQHWGLSGRGLALNAGTDLPEEFPEFREFWLEKPSPGDQSLRILALLDSPSVAGAYEFIITPSNNTTVKVRSRLYFRREVEHVGLAPLSSMFYFGENSAARPFDFRSEIHDSDGVLLNYETDTEWRPLANPSSYRNQYMNSIALKSYGLMQRDQIFENYQDIEAEYHRRPSVWITPVKMPIGQVVLHEFHTDSEYNDNVTLFWEPQISLKAENPFSFEYELAFTRKLMTETGYVAATRIGKTVFKAEPVYQVVVDFDGAELREIVGMEHDVLAHIDTGEGIELVNSILLKNPFNNQWRLTLLLRIPSGHYGSDIKAFLTMDGRKITETWSYQWIE
jgi:periplasmic glucans biosynthesis protein